MPRRMSAKRAAEKRDKLMKKANEHFLKMQELEDQAMELDDYISENCDHPKEFQKLKKFTKSIPQSSMWLCTLCYQTTIKNPEAVEKEREELITSMLDEVWEELPMSATGLE